MSRSVVRHGFLPAALLLLVGLTQTARAQTYTFFPSDATINYAISTTFAIVGYANANDYYYQINGTSPTVSLVDGGIGVQLIAYNRSTVTVSGGNLENSLSAYGNSTVNVTGGSIGNYLYAYNRKVTVSGGSIGNDLIAYNSSKVTITGGNFGNGFYAHDSSTVNVSGGNIGYRLFAYESSTITLFGAGLKATPVNPDFDSFSQYTLSGTLLDGTSVNGKNLYLQNGSNARFNLVNATPKPARVNPHVG